MRFEKVFNPLLVVCLSGTLVVGAKTPPVPKNHVVSAKTSAGSKSSSKTSHSRARTTSARGRKPSGPPRQTQPTAERYMEIQQALAERGFYQGPIDGNWTAACVEALKRFQTDQNLAADGKLGALSLIALGLGPNRQESASQLLTKPGFQTEQ